MGIYNEDAKKLPHFSNIPQAADLDEPIWKSLFEINFILPTALREDGRDPILLLYSAQNVSLPLTPEISIATQRYKYSTRAYVGMPENTHLESISIKFSVNQNIKLSVPVWNTLKAWYDLVWNSQTGEINYKRDIVGTIIVNQHDKRGEVIRRVVYHNAQLRGINGVELEWGSSTEIYEAEVTFVVDYWDDIYYDER